MRLKLIGQFKIFFLWETKNPQNTSTFGVLVILATQLLEPTRRKLKTLVKKKSIFVVGETNWIWKKLRRCSRKIHENVLCVKNSEEILK